MLNKLNSCPYCNNISRMNGDGIRVDPKTSPLLIYIPMECQTCKKVWWLETYVRQKLIYKIDGEVDVVKV